MGSVSRERNLRSTGTQNRGTKAWPNLGRGGNPPVASRFIVFIYNWDTFCKTGPPDPSNYSRLDVGRRVRWIVGIATAISPRLFASENTFVLPGYGSCDPEKLPFLRGWEACPRDTARSFFKNPSPISREKKKKRFLDTIQIFLLLNSSQ